MKGNAEFLMKLTERRQLSQVALGDVITGCRGICQKYVADIQQGIVSTLKEAGINPHEIMGLAEILLPLPDPFEGIDSAHLRETFYTKPFQYVVSPFEILK